MAKTGFCDSKPLLDLHKNVEERRVPLRTWANACGPKERWQPQEGARAFITKTEPEHRWAWRLPVSTDDGIIMGYHEDDSPARSADGSGEEAVLLYLHGLQGRHSLRAYVPELLRHALEGAMENLGLVFDRTYSRDIFTDMMRNQFRYTFPNTDLPPPFTDTTRAILVDWLIQVHEIFHFSEETLYLSVHLLDRCLRQLTVTTSNLQLLGLVCLFLAAKKEECLLPEVSELCYLMDNCYTKRQLLRMERKVFCQLNFDLSHCPPLHFLLISASIARCSAKVVWMSRYLLELSLLESQCVVFLPFQLAGAALCLARRVLQEPPTPEGETAWCVASSMHVGSEATLMRIMHLMAGAAARAHNRDTRATFLKFSYSETMNVSRHPVLVSAPFLLGLPTAHT